MRADENVGERTSSRSRSRRAIRASVGSGAEPGRASSDAHSAPPNRIRGLSSA